MKKSRLLEIIREEITSILNENTINEMAKISGNLKSNPRQSRFRRFST